MAFLLETVKLEAGSFIPEGEEGNQYPIRGIFSDSTGFRHDKDRKP